MLASEVSELSPKEEDHIREILSYPTHAYPDLVTPGHLHKFGPDTSSSPSFFVIFGLASFYLSPPFLFSLFSTFLSLLPFLYIRLASDPGSILLCSKETKQKVFSPSSAGQGVTVMMKKWKWHLISEGPSEVA